MNKALRVLTNEDLMEVVIDWALAPCARCDDRYHPMDEPCGFGATPSHALLRVCQLWFPAAARRLWAGVGLEQLLWVLTLQQDPSDVVCLRKLCM